MNQIPIGKQTVRSRQQELLYYSRSKDWQRKGTIDIDEMVLLEGNFENFVLQDVSPEISEAIQRCCTKSWVNHQ